MRWIKHMTATRRDEKIADLISRFGMAGYGVWWAVVEVVAEKVEKDSHPSVTYPVSTWSHLLSLRGSHVRQAILKLELTHLVTAIWSGSDLTVTIPNLLKYRDEYTQRSGHYPDKLPSKKQKQNTEAEADTQTEKSEASVRPEFDDQWQDFRRLYQETGKPLIEQDFQRAWFTWRLLDFEQKTHAIVNLAARKLHHDPQFIPNPEKYLHGGEYLRAVVPRKSNGNSRHDQIRRAMEEA